VGRDAWLKPSALRASADNGKDLTSPSSDLFVADDGYTPSRVLTTVRIGIVKAAVAPAAIRDCWK